MNISHIDHINIVVSDIVAAKNFFKKLGFIVKAERDLEGDWIDKTVGLKNVKAQFVAMKIQDGQTMLELLQYKFPMGSIDPQIGSANQIGYRHIALCVDDIDAWYLQLQKVGIECFSGVQQVPNYKGKKIVYFKGPEGIILELAQYPKN